MNRNDSSRFRPAGKGLTMADRRCQRGAVLVVALVLLVALTLIGVSAMNTTSLDERMAANAQQMNVAYQTAETGLSEALRDPDAYDITGTYSPGPQNLLGDPNYQYEYTTEFKGWSDPPATKDKWDETQFQAAHFEFECRGESTGGANIQVTLFGGVFQIAPRSESELPDADQTGTDVF